MKKSILLVLSAIFVFCSCGNNKVQQSSDEPSVGQVQEYPSRFSVKRGTNIAHWLSQSKRRGRERSEFFTRRDVEYIKSAGFDHIRLPVDEEQLWDSTGRRE